MRLPVNRSPATGSIREVWESNALTAIDVELNRKDFQNLSLPAILLDGDHYFAVLERHGQQVIVYDTLLSTKREIKLPDLNDPDFRATVLAFSIEGLNEDTLSAGAPAAPDRHIPGAQPHPPASGTRTPSPQNPPVATHPSAQETHSQSHPSPFSKRERAG